MFQELSKSSIFNGLTLDEIKGCLDKIKYKISEYEKDEIIIFREDPLNDLIIIIDGILRTEMTKVNGKSFKVEDLSKSQIIAPAFLFGNNPILPVDVIVAQKAKLLVISKKDFLNLLQFNQKVLENYLNALSNKTQFLSKKIWFLNKSLEEKLAEYFLKNSNENFEIKLKHSIKELALEFNVARPSLSRIIKNWIENKIIERLSSNTFKIIDSDKLSDKF